MSSPRIRTRLGACAATVSIISAACLLADPVHAATPGVTPAVTPAVAASVHNGPIAIAGGYPDPWLDVNPDGSDNGGRHAVTPSGGGLKLADGIGNLAFSPDGTKAVFESVLNDSLWISNSDGSGAVKLTTPPATQTDAEPTWSNDGSTVYFTRIDWNVQAQPLYSVPATGGTPTQVVAKPDSNGHWAAAGNGAYVAYSAQSTSAFPSVVVMDAKTHTTVATIPDSGAPSYSRDGKTLRVLTVDPSGATSPVIVDWAPDGSGTGQQVTSVPGAPTYSPDETQIAYFGHPKTGGCVLDVMTLATGAVTTIDSTVDVSVCDVSISWQNGPSYTGPTTVRPPLPGTATRLGGTDRIDTAVKAAAWPFSANLGISRRASAAVLSRDDNFADALAGNALAGQKDAPLLLTASDHLDPRVQNELRLALPANAKVYLLGGEDALGPAVFDAVRSLGFTPVRLGGADRFETATKIAAEISPHPHTVIVATGTDYPDALAAGAAAAQDPAGGVVVLSDHALAPDATRAYLAGLDLAKTDVYGVGGAGLAAVEAALPADAGRIIPLAGADRFATAAAVAGGKLFSGVTLAGIATGSNWPDALAGGALAGRGHGPILLADRTTMPQGELDWLTANRTTLTGLVVFGGTAVVPDRVLYQAADAAWPGGWNIDVPRAVHGRF